MSRLRRECQIMLLKLYFDFVMVGDFTAHVFYSPVVKACVVNIRPMLFIPAYAVPVCFVSQSVF
jgi:hypothetical protein